ncbi:hypothetical protein [Henriciella aquimarina]|uniref:hypothetical protein n=1 Tax=Henriciella aquimarina TaxID=545261 RepID=UPI00117B0C93|nr:hypothetical protein [Henriciella aquimarina]
MPLSEAAVAQANPEKTVGAEAVAEIGPDESGNWRVEYTFDTPQKVLAFARSESDYRDATWFVEGDGVRFGRVAGADVIVFDDPSRTVAFSLIPLTNKPEADYTPFVTFGDGGLAIHEGQFSLIPFESRDAVEALDGDLSAAEVPQLPMTVRLSSDKPIIVDGETYQGQVEHRLEGDGTYIYMGDSAIESFDSFTAILDRTLPEWLQSRFDSDLEAIFAGLEARWGFGLEDKASVMLAFKEGRSDGFSATGEALDQLLMMEVGGKDLAEPGFDTLSYLQWFFAHEAIHLFQKQRGVGFAGGGEAWIHEGAANTMAYSLIADMVGPEDGPKFLSGVYANAFETCVGALEKGSLETAQERGDASAHYACGDFIALATDGFLPRRSLYDFWNRLTTLAAANDKTQVDADLYFSTVQLLGVRRSQRDMLREIVEEELDNPRKALTDLLDAAGLDPQFNDKDQLIKLNWPDYSAE